jgi:4a-hydroxytetrahydrobiopterin dehydratase
MTEALHHKHCVPCEGGTKPLTKKEIAPLIKSLQAWNVLADKKIEKKYSFIDFKHAISFVNEVADVAEYEGHHPDINLHNWNQVTITLLTHAVKGLTENDFIMAAKIDQIIKDAETV